MNAIRRRVPGRLGRIVGLAAVLAVVPLFALESSYHARLLDIFLIFSLVAVALNIVFGHTDQLFLFMGGLAGAGAYVTAILADEFGVTAWITLLAGALFCGAVGALVSWVAAKRQFTVILISILTLTLQLVFHEIFVGARDLTGGSTGIGFEGLGLGDIATSVGVSRNIVLYYLLLVLLVGVLVLYVRLIDSKYGLAFSALREDEIAAEAIGIDVVRYKTIAGFVAAAIIGVAGVMFATLQQYISPTMYTFLGVDVLVLIMVVIGGIRTMAGPIVGAAGIIAMRELLQTAGQWRTAIFGGLLIVLFLYFRSGILPAISERLSKSDLAVQTDGESEPERTTDEP